MTLRLGGKWDMPALGLKGKPLPVTGTVTKITDGRFKVTGPMFTGVTMSIGATAVMDTGTVEIVVCSQPFEPFDLGPFTHAGIDPTEKKYLLIKSRQHFRAGFEPIAEHILLVDGPGVCSSDYSLFNFENIGHSVYPLDPNAPKSIIGK
jgi:microcystin degradation protein MlrC